MSSPPDWLSLPNKEIETVNTRESKELFLVQMETIFETILDNVTKGISLKRSLDDDIRDLDRTAVLKWIFKDPERKARYYEAQEIGSEILASELLDIADGVDLEDVQRSKLKIDTRKDLMGFWNKSRYSPVKRIESEKTISIKTALDLADKRVMDVPFEDI